MSAETDRDVLKMRFPSIRAKIFRPIPAAFPPHSDRSKFNPLKYHIFNFKDADLTCAALPHFIGRQRG
jgi:hypothetical protein